MELIQKYLMIRDPYFRGFLKVQPISIYQSKITTAIEKAKEESYESIGVPLFSHALKMGRQSGKTGLLQQVQERGIRISSELQELQNAPYMDILHEYQRRLTEQATQHFQQQLFNSIMQGSGVPREVLVERGYENARSVSPVQAIEHVPDYVHPSVDMSISDETVIQEHARGARANFMTFADIGPEPVQFDTDMTGLFTRRDFNRIAFPSDAQAVHPPIESIQMVINLSPDDVKDNGGDKDGDVPSIYDVVFNENKEEKA